MLTGLNARNTAAVEVALREMTSRQFAQQERIDALQAALSAMTERMTVLERMLVVQKVQAMGHGPTAA